MNKALYDLPPISHPNLIVGIDKAEDAGVYKLREDLAIVQTLDFFTPIVDDPYTFGQIAVVNSLSDVYAMGGKPIVAMNIVCFPVKTMDILILQEILQGGLDKMREAEVVLVGGHSVEDSELKYGLSVTGVVHPEKVWTNRGIQVDDDLILTKPLGTGIVSTAIKHNLAHEELVAESVQSMSTLNKKTAEVMRSFDIHACTDITGFGFLGHACEMVEDAAVGMIIYSSSVPFFRKIKECIEMGMVPGGLHRNREFRMPMIEISSDCPQWVVDALFDPQTSGGLFFSIPPQQADGLIKKLHEEGVEEATVVGKVVKDLKGRILVR